MKQCKKCLVIKLKTEFPKNSSKKEGYNCACKSCANEHRRKNIEKYRKAKIEWANKNRQSIRNINSKYKKNNKEVINSINAARRAVCKKATPKWANKEKIKNFYKNCPEGYEVDHVIPLNSNIVCGLHVETNLQYLSKIENTKKSNKF